MCPQLHQLPQDSHITGTSSLSLPSTELLAFFKRGTLEAELIQGREKGELCVTDLFVSKIFCDLHEMIKAWGEYQ